MFYPGMHFLFIENLNLKFFEDELNHESMLSITEMCVPHDLLLIYKLNHNYERHESVV